MIPIKFIISILIFPLGILAFLLFYFRGALDKPGGIGAMVFLFMLFFIPAIIVFICSLPFVSAKIISGRYYSAMKWDAETIAQYESDLKLHDKQVRKWKITK